MRLPALFALLLAIPLLNACVDDRAAMEIDGTREHYLALVREQPWFWDKKVNLYLVVSRMPACLRRHNLGAGTENTRVEIWQVPSGAFIVKAGRRMFVTESQTCVSWARLEEEPEDGMGELLGVFRVRQGQLVFAAETPGAAGGEDE